MVDKRHQKKRGSFPRVTVSSNLVVWETEYCIGELVMAVPGSVL